MGVVRGLVKGTGVVAGRQPVQLEKGPGGKIYLNMGRGFGERGPNRVADAVAARLLGEIPKGSIIKLGRNSCEN
jgi:hypothetical protein